MTPNYLQQIDVTFCPITRTALNNHRADVNSRSIDRVRNDAGYAAGNVVMLSRAANEAKVNHDRANACAMAHRIATDSLRNITALNAEE